MTDPVPSPSLAFVANRPVEAGLIGRGPQDRHQKKTTDRNNVPAGTPPKRATLDALFGVAPTSRSGHLSPALNTISAKREQDGPSLFLQSCHPPFFEPPTLPGLLGSAGPAILSILYTGGPTRARITAVSRILFMAAFALVSIEDDRPSYLALLRP